MSKHIIQELHASVTTSRGTAIDHETSVCIEFNSDRGAFYPFKVFQKSGMTRGKEYGAETLSDATELSSSMLIRLTQALLVAA